MKTRAAVAFAAQKPLEIVEIDLDDLYPQLLVFPDLIPCD
jgi:Zn-dependent alcohol dehydrogenase